MNLLAFSGFLVKLPDLEDSGTQWILAPSSMRWGLGALMSHVADVPLWAKQKFGFGEEVWHLNTVVNLVLSCFPLMGTILILRLRDRV